MRRWVLVLLALFGAFFCTSAPADDAAVTAQLQQVIDDYVAKRASIEGLSGAALQVDRGGGHPPIEVFAGANGLSDAKPIGPDTLFQIGSNTKEFTAALILKLEAAGKLQTRRHDRALAAAISGMAERDHSVPARHDERHPQLFGDGRDWRDRGRRHPPSIQRQGFDRLRRPRQWPPSAAEHGMVLLQHQLHSGGPHHRGGFGPVLRAGADDTDPGAAGPT